MVYPRQDHRLDSPREALLGHNPQVTHCYLLNLYEAKSSLVAYHSSLGKSLHAYILVGNSPTLMVDLHQDHRLDSLQGALPGHNPQVVHCCVWIQMTAVFGSI